MIKHLLSVVVVLLMSASSVLAQTFEFRYHGESLADGTTVTIAAEENDFGEIACETNPTSNPNNGLVLQLLSGNQAQGTATLSIVENTLICNNINWCMGGLCSSLSNTTSLTKSFSFNNGICQVQFDAIDIMSDGYLIATLTATIDGVTRMVNIKFINGEQTDDASFEFRYHGMSLADGATVTIAAEENDFGEIACETNPSSNPNNGLVLQLLSGNYSQGAATMAINENTLICGNVSWCMGGLCSSFTNNTTSLTKTFSFNNGICQVQFDAIDILNDGHMFATLTAVVGGVTRTVKIKFTNGEQTVVIGDVNGDGSVNAADVTALYDWLLNSDDGSLVNGDQDGDGSITAGDITSVYSILLGN